MEEHSTAQLCFLRSTKGRHGIPTNLVRIFIRRCGMTEQEYLDLCERKWVQTDPDNVLRLTKEGLKQYKKLSKGRYF